VTGNHILANEGIVDGLGHISVRSNQRSDRFLLSRDRAPGLITADDLVEYDLEGKPTNPQAPQGYQERFIHAAIYKARSDVMSVVHAHTPSVLAYADSTVQLRPMNHMASFLEAGVPVFEIRHVSGSSGMLVNDMTDGNALASTLGVRPVALMRGHGLVVVGSNIPDAVSRAIFTDVNARVQAQAIALGGTVAYLTPKDIEASAATAASKPPTPLVDVYPRSWPYWKQRATAQ
jgi:HCOMODA/2-hydroxy-3-carboxy-muconic semialdehyde decarboxylase